MHKTSVFSAQTIIETDIERLYAFHENPHNILEITPAWQRIDEVSADPTAVSGGQFAIRIRLAGIFPLKWQGVWRVTDRPAALIDEMIDGPFAFWRHEHRFEALDAGRTRMTDRVEYRFFGGFFGKLFGETLGRLQFRLMFADRHARTRRRLREQK